MAQSRPICFLSFQQQKKSPKGESWQKKKKTTNIDGERERASSLSKNKGLNTERKIERKKMHSGEEMFIFFCSGAAAAPLLSSIYPDLYTHAAQGVVVKKKKVRGRSLQLHLTGRLESSLSLLGNRS